MTVKQLITELEKFPPDEIVYCEYDQQVPELTSIKYQEVYKLNNFLHTFQTDEPAGKKIILDWGNL